MGRSSDKSHLTTTQKIGRCPTTLGQIVYNIFDKFVMVRVVISLIVLLFFAKALYRYFMEIAELIYPT